MSRSSSRPGRTSGPPSGRRSWAGSRHPPWSSHHWDTGAWHSVTCHDNCHAGHKRVSPVTMSPVPSPVPAFLRHLAKCRTFLFIIDSNGLCHFIVVCDLTGEDNEIFLTLVFLKNFYHAKLRCPSFFIFNRNSLDKFNKYKYRSNKTYWYHFVLLWMIIRIAKRHVYTNTTTGLES